jgi:hypothetical protein
MRVRNGRQHAYAPLIGIIAIINGGARSAERP